MNYIQELVKTFFLVAVYGSIFIKVAFLEMDPQVISEWSTAFILTVWQQLFSEIKRRLDFLQEIEEEVAAEAERKRSQAKKRQRPQEPSEPREPHEEPETCNHRCDHCNRQCGRHTPGHLNHSCWYHRHHREGQDNSK